MVNENFDEFINTQKKHKGQYLGKEKANEQGVAGSKYNQPENTDKSVGSTGRDL